jgi:hypothetical protein
MFHYTRVRVTSETFMDDVETIPPWISALRGGFIIKSIKRDLKTRPIYDLYVVYYKSRKRELKGKLMNESV